MNERVGIFELVDPPPGQADIIRAAIEAIDYPWERLAPAIADDPDGAVAVEWDDTGQSTSGQYSGTHKIRLGTRPYHLDAGAGFVFAHEVGHLVDDVALTDDQRADLMALTHASPKTYRDDGRDFNGGPWPTAHEWPHVEEWRASGNDYAFRHNEAFADLFVEAFAPTVWDGSFYPDAPSRGPDWLRFVHTTDDLAAVRAIALRQDAPALEPEPPKKEAPPMPVDIRWWPSPNNSGGNYDKWFICIHATVSRETGNGAELVAGWFSDPDFNASTQYIVDNRDIIQTVRETAYAWSAGTTANKYGIHIELVAMPGQTRSEWSDDYSDDELRLAARLTAELCAKHKIPIRKIGPADLRAERDGICGHDDVRDAWHETTHWDPGPHFPWGRFINYVREAAEGDDMPSVDDIFNHEIKMHRGEKESTTPFWKVIRELEEEQDRQAKKLDEILDLLRPDPNG